MTDYERVIEIMYDLKNKYGGEITELFFQKKCCTYFDLKGWSFYVKCGEGDLSIYVPYEVKNDFRFYITNKSSIFHLFKNNKRLQIASNADGDIYYNTNNRQLFDKTFMSDIIKSLHELGRYEVIGNKILKKVDKNIKYLAIKTHYSVLNLSTIIETLEVVKNIIKVLHSIEIVATENFYSAQYLFNDYRNKKSSYFLYKKLEEENGGQAVPTGEENFPLGGYKKDILNYSIVFKNKDISNFQNKSFKRITEVSANIPIRTGFYMKVKLKSPVNKYVNEIYNVSPLEEFEDKYYVKSSDYEIVDKILDDEIKRNIARIQMGEFFINSFEGINFICDSEVGEYEQAISIVRVIEKLIKKSYFINEEITV